MLLDSCCSDLPVIWVILVTQPMCLNLPRLLIVSFLKDHHTQQIYSTFYHSDWVILCTEVPNCITQRYIQNCTTLHKDWPALRTTSIRSEWVSSLTWSCPVSQWFHRVTMISPSHNDFTESHSLNIRWSSHLRWPAWPFSESPTLSKRLHFGSILGKYLNYSSPASYLIYGKYLKLHIWSMANILSSGRQHKLKGEHWRATQIEGWSQTLGI